MLSQLATLVLSLLTVVLLPKYVGPAPFGSFGAALTFVAFFALAATLGSHPYLLKTLARDRSGFDHYMFNAVLMKLVVSVLVSAVAVGMALALQYSGLTLLLIEIAAAGIPLSALSDVMAAGVRADGSDGLFAFGAAAQRYVAGAVGLGLLVTHHGIIAYTLAITATGVVSILAYSGRLRTNLRDERRLDLHLWREIALGGLPYVLWGGILLVYGSIDILMLQRMTNMETVGWYNLAYTWIAIPVLFPSLLVTAVFPALSARALSDSSAFNVTVNKALKLGVLVGTPMAIGISLTAPDIIRLFHYPGSFSHAVPLMRILSLHIPIVAMDMILAVALTARDRQKAWLLVGCIAAVFNPALNLYAIPATQHRYGNGAIGASVVTVATEIVLMVGGILLRPAGILDRRAVSFLGRTVGASAFMIPPVLLAGTSPFALKVLVGVASFAAGCFLLRLVTWSSCRAQAAHLLATARSRRSIPSIPTSMESSS